MTERIETGELKFIVSDSIFLTEKKGISKENYFEVMLPALEKELQRHVGEIQNGLTDELYEMLAYHLGWTNEAGQKPTVHGKRIRPLMMMLVAEGLGQDWRTVLPAAAAIELVHNFSLIHDDIQDHSDLRRGRPTVWKKWGVDQAINAGDAMFALAHQAILRLGDNTSAASVLQALDVMTQACMGLAQGQYLDLNYERENDLSQEAYWYMVTRKTASLIAASCELGAILAGAGANTRTACRKLGESLGLAFQAKDDFLGIWGNEAQIGKPVTSDLLSRKKSLPIVFALEANGEFAAWWKQDVFVPEEIPNLVSLLENDGAREYTLDMVNGLTDLALEEMQEIPFSSEHRSIISDLIFGLLHREK